MTSSTVAIEMTQFSAEMGMMFSLVALGLTLNTASQEMIHCLAALSRILFAEV
jgi:hypothetical protein